MKKGRIKMRERERIIKPGINYKAVTGYGEEIPIIRPYSSQSSKKS